MLRAELIPSRDTYQQMKKIIHDRIHVDSDPIDSDPIVTPLPVDTADLEIRLNQVLEFLEHETHLTPQAIVHALQELTDLRYELQIKGSFVAIAPAPKLPAAEQLNRLEEALARALAEEHLDQPRQVLDRWAELLELAGRKQIVDLLIDGLSINPEKLIVEVHLWFSRQINRWPAKDRLLRDINVALFSDEEEADSDPREQYPHQSLEEQSKEFDERCEQLKREGKIGPRSTLN